jgi:hypothetical protein
MPPAEGTMELDLTIHANPAPAGIDTHSRAERLKGGLPGRVRCR